MRAASAQSPSYAELAPLLRGLLGEGQRRYHLHLRQSPAIQDFLSDPQLEALSQVGCATPDHVIRTKRYPLVLGVDGGRGIAEQRASIAERLSGYRARYREYVQRQSARKRAARRAK